MAFETYLTYEEYVSFGGKVSEDAFPIYERKARHQLNYITDNRIKYLTEIPEVVKEVMTEFITKMFNNDVALSDSAGVSKSYSNGVESVTFSENSQELFQKELSQIAYKWLPTYLTTRVVNFDVAEYLQSVNNNS